MYRSIYDLKVFYNSPSGEMVRAIVQRHINAWWGDMRDQRVLGIGFTQPYLEHAIDRAERCFAVMPAGQGGYPWPGGAKKPDRIIRRIRASVRNELIDRVFLIHSLEHAELLRSNLQEIWRVLKGNGRLLIVTPNRAGFWSRADWSPFGQGTPYSSDQLRSILRENLFVYERHKPILFVPPLRKKTIIGAADGFEKIGPYLFPAFAGLHMIEASKQMYAGVDLPDGAKVKVRGRGNLIPNPVRLSHN